MIRLVPTSVWGVLLHIRTLARQIGRLDMTVSNLAKGALRTMKRLIEKISRDNCEDLKNFERVSQYVYVPLNRHKKAQCSASRGALVFLGSRILSCWS